MESWEQQTVIAGWIWIGIILLGMFTFSIMYLIRKHLRTIADTKKMSAEKILKSKKEFTQRVTYLQELDRKRLAEELHDNVTSRLHLLNLNLYEGEIGMLKKNLKTSMKIVRELSHSFTPVSLSSIDISELLDDYLVQLQDTFEVSYTIQRLTPKSVFSNEVKLNLFRIFQELISNIIKHANATKIHVHLRYSEQSIILLVQDDGEGFDVRKKYSGIGMSTIELRVATLRGRYKYKTKPTRFILYIPHKNK